jgi:hypothetical protein
LALAAVTAGGACPSSGPQRAATVPDYHARVLARIEAEGEATSFEVRHNPTPCACPAWEMRLDGVWHRVAFDVSDRDEDPTLAALNAALGRPEVPGQGPATWRIQGQLDDALEVCSRGTLYVTFAPSAFGEPPPPPEAPAPEED